MVDIVEFSCRYCPLHGITWRISLLVVYLRTLYRSWTVVSINGLEVDESTLLVTWFTFIAYYMIWFSAQFDTQGSYLVSMNYKREGKTFGFYFGTGWFQYTHRSHTHKKDVWF